MSSFNKKLVDRLGEYQSAGILDAATRQRFEIYLNQQISDARGTAGVAMRYVMYALAALVMACGVILLFAHNWDILPKFARLAAGFIPLAVSVALGIWYFLTQTKRSKSWCEIIPALSMVGIITAIMIVSQVYQIQGSLEGFILTVILLSLPLPFIFNSGLASGVLLWLPVCFFCDHFRVSSAFFIWGVVSSVVVGGFLLYSYFRGERHVLKSLALGMLPIAFPLFILVSILSFSDFSDSVGIFVFTAFYGAMAAIFAVGTHAENEGYAVFAKTTTLLGTTITLFLLPYLLDASGWVKLSWTGNYPAILNSPSAIIAIVLASLLTVIQVFWIGRALRKKTADKALVGVSFCLLIGLLNFFGYIGLIPMSFSPAMTVLSNLACIALGLIYIVHGLSTFSLLRLNLGAILLMSYVIIKFVAAYNTLLLWAVGFIVLGFVLLGINALVLFLRKKGIC